jgi:hypothetical protein
VHEVVQHTEVKVHANLIEHCFESGIEGLAVLGDDQGGADGTQALGRRGCAAGG